MVHHTLKGQDGLAGSMAVLDGGLFGGGGEGINERGDGK